MYERMLQLQDIITRRSVFLFGPRTVGKTTLLIHLFPHAKMYDLLENSTFSRLLRRPSLIEEENSAEEIIIIDEIQKLPMLLDETHRLIQKRNQKFILTGSSARKLKRGSANLLAGRARWASLFPLVSREIPDFHLDTYLTTGGLPHIYGDSEAHLDLSAYVDLYIRQEIQAESLTRNIQGFAHLLDSLGLMNGEQLNYSSIASDTGLQARTVMNYIEILEDTLLAFRLPVYFNTRKRKAASRQKLYFFDIGVVHALRRSFSDITAPEVFGKCFEHFIILEVRAYISYSFRDDPLTFWRCTTGFEVDLVIGDHTAIEIKASTLVTDKHMKGLRALKEEVTLNRTVVVSQDTEYRKTTDGIEIMPWKHFLQELWNNQIC